MKFLLSFWALMYFMKIFFPPFIVNFLFLNWLITTLKLFFSESGSHVGNRSFIKTQTSGTSSDNEWQRVTTNDNEWYSEWQRVTTSSTTSDNEWEWVTMNDNEWQRVRANDNEWYNEWQRVVQRMKANESDFRFQNEKFMQCKTTMYSATSFWKYNVKQNICQSSHRRCFIKKLLLTILRYSQENNLKACNFIKKRLQHKCFLMNIVKFLRTPI